MQGGGEMNNLTIMTGFMSCILGISALTSLALHIYDGSVSLSVVMCIGVLYVTSLLIFKGLRNE